VCIRRVGFIAYVGASRACCNLSVRVHVKMVNARHTVQ